MYDDGLLCKYGKSSRVFEREHYEHKKDYGEQIKVVIIVHTDNNDIVEKLFEQVIKTKELNRKLKFNGKDRDELFITTNKFTLNDAINTMNLITENNPLPGIKERDHKIKELQYKIENDKDIILEKEKTKQKELDVNLKIKELETNLRLKEIELRHKGLDIKQLEINEDVSNDPRKIRAQKQEDKRINMKKQIQKLVEVGDTKKDRILKCDILALFYDHFQLDTHMISSILLEMGVKNCNTKVQGKSMCYYTFIKLKNGVDIPKNKMNNDSDMDIDTMKSEISKFVKITKNKKDQVDSNILENLLVEKTSQNIKSVHKSLLLLGVKRFCTTKNNSPVRYYCGVKLI
jgi:hypothetical protein